LRLRISVLWIRKQLMKLLHASLLCGAVLAGGFLGRFLYDIAHVQERQAPREMVIPTRHDFGRVLQGEQLNWSIPLCHSAESPVTVKHVRTSCGCVTTNFHTVPTASCESPSSLAVTWDTKDGKGPQIRKVYVETTEGLRVYELSAMVVEPYGVYPRVLDFQDIEAGVGAERHTVLVTAAADGVSVRVGPRSPEPWIRVNVGAPRRQPNGLARRVLSVGIRDTAPLGSFLVSIGLTLTSRKGDLEVTIPVSGRVVPNVKAAPATVAFGRLRRGTVVRREILLHGRFRPLAVAAAASTNPNVRVELHQISQGEYSLKTVFVAEELGPINGRIELRRPGDTEPPTRVPIEGFVVP